MDEIYFRRRVLGAIISECLGISERIRFFLFEEMSKNLSLALVMDKVIIIVDGIVAVVFFILVDRGFLLRVYDLVFVSHKST